MVKRFFAEFLATAILVLVGCGAAMAFTFAGYAGTPAGTVGIAAAAIGTMMLLARVVLLQHSVSQLSSLLMHLVQLVAVMQTQLLALLKHLTKN